MEIKVKYDVIDQFAKDNNLVYLSTSAKCKDRIDHLFRIIGYDLYDNLEFSPKNNMNNNIQVIRNLSNNNINNYNNNQNGKCC